MKVLAPRTLKRRIKARLQKALLGNEAPVPPAVETSAPTPEIINAEQVTGG